MIDRSADLNVPTNSIVAERYLRPGIGAAANMGGNIVAAEGGSAASSAPPRRNAHARTVSSVARAGQLLAALERSPEVTAARPCAGVQATMLRALMARDAVTC